MTRVALSTRGELAVGSNPRPRRRMGVTVRIALAVSAEEAACMDTRSRLGVPLRGVPRFGQGRAQEVRPLPRIRVERLLPAVRPPPHVRNTPDLRGPSGERGCRAPRACRPGLHGTHLRARLPGRLEAPAGADRERDRNRPGGRQGGVRIRVGCAWAAHRGRCSNGPSRKKPANSRSREADARIRTADPFITSLRSTHREIRSFAGNSGIRPETATLSNSAVLHAPPGMCSNGVPIGMYCSGVVPADGSSRKSRLVTGVLAVRSRDR